MISGSLRWTLFAQLMAVKTLSIISIFSGWVNLWNVVIMSILQVKSGSYKYYLA